MWDKGYLFLLLRARPKAERVLLRIRENPEYERCHTKAKTRNWQGWVLQLRLFSIGRQSGRPAAVVTLLRCLYLLNRKPDWQAVFFGGYPHTFYRVWDKCRIIQIPTVARGACHSGVSVGCPKFPACCFSVTAGPIALKFCMRLGSH